MITRFIKKRGFFGGIYILLQACLKHEYEAALDCLELTPFLCRLSAQVVRLIEIAFPLDKTLISDGKKWTVHKLVTPCLFCTDEQTFQANHIFWTNLTSSQNLSTQSQKRGPENEAGTTDKALLLATTVCRLTSYRV